MAGLGDYLETVMGSPLFLGGAALASGEGFGGAMQGMAAGNKFREEARKRQQQEQMRTLAQRLASDPKSGIDPNLAQVFTVQPELVGQYLIKQPDREAENRRINLLEARDKRDAEMDPVRRAQMIAETNSRIEADRRAASLHPGTLEAQRQGLDAASIGQWDSDKPMYRRTKDGRIEWITPPSGGADMPTSSTIKNEAELRKEYTGQPQIKEYQTVRNAFQNVKNAARDPSAAGDLSMIFAYMKMLDPNSVVREQEFANAQNAAGVPDRVVNLYNRILRGERLNPEQRKDFLAQADKLHSTSMRQYEAVRRQFGDIAKNARARPEQVMIDFGEVPDPNAPPNPNAAPPIDSQPMPRRVQNKDGVILEERNGQWVRVN